MSNNVLSREGAMYRARIVRYSAAPCRMMRSPRTVNNVEVIA